MTNGDEILKGFLVVTSLVDALSTDMKPENVAKISEFYPKVDVLAEMKKSKPNATETDRKLLIEHLLGLRDTRGMREVRRYLAERYQHED